MSETVVKERFHNLWYLPPVGLKSIPPTGSPKSEGLRVSDWRSELLQVMFWLKNEDFGDDVDAALLERFLGAGSRVDVEDLDRLSREGYLERVGSRYTLSEAGYRKARLEFAASCEEFTRPIPAECSRAAWCSRVDT
jgi:hypothetical protein